MENMTTENHAQTISDSLTNGQFKQAKSQLVDALHDGCGATALLADICGFVGVAATLSLAGSLIGDNVSGSK